MIKEAIEYVVGLGQPETYEIEGLPYSSKKLHHILPGTPGPMQVSTLTSVVDYISSMPDGQDEQSGQFVYIHSPQEVRVVCPVKSHGVRATFIQAMPELPQFNMQDFVSLDEFIPRVQAGFVDGFDKANLIKVVSHVSHDTKMGVTDDGTSQQVEVRAGIRKEYEDLPNPVTLAPFCTFPEIKQPGRSYVLRMDRRGDSLSARLIDADGGAWRAVAIQRIKEYLADKIQVPILA